MTGPLVLVTGGAGAIGREVARLFAKDGSRVVVADFNYSGALEFTQTLPGPKGQHLALKVDVGSADSVDQLADDVLRHYGGESPSVIVNSAGIVGNIHGLLGGTEAEWDNLMRVNLKGTFLICKKFINLMVAQKRKGSIVNLASIAMYGFQLAPDYSASKAGVVGLTKAIAKEFGPKGIRVNAVAPVFLENSMADGTPDYILKSTKKLTPLKRIGTPLEVAELCYFLAGDKASFITGDVHHITGGLFT